MKNGIYRPASVYGDDGIACLRMYNIESGRVVWRDIKRMRLSSKEIADYELVSGDLLVNRVNSRELVGKAAVIPDGIDRCVFESKNIRMRLRRDLVEPKFVNFQLLLSGGRYFTRNAQQVVGMASVSQPQVSAFPLAFPGLDEQRRIVAEIEKEFTRLEYGISRLVSLKSRCRAYRSAVLSYACRGELIVSGVAPAQWNRATLAELTDHTRKSAYGVLQPGPEVNDGIPLVRVGDIDQGRVVTGKLKRIAPSIAAQYPRTTLRGGELVITLVGAIGRTALVPPNLSGANVARAVAVVPLSKEVVSRWVEIWLRQPSVQVELLNNAHEVARKTLNLEDVRRTLVALPPIEEQEQIVAEVERRLSVVDELERVVEANLQRSRTLRQSILQKAFSGQL